MEKLNLTKEEIREITCRVRPAYQVKALRTMGIPFKIRPDGTPLVCRSAYCSIMNSKETRKNKSDVCVPLDLTALEKYCKKHSRKHKS